MAINNYDGIINARANGGADDPIYIKNTSITPAAAGNWLSLLRSAGSPGPMVGTAGNNGGIMNVTDPGAIPLINPGSNNKYLLKCGVSVPSNNGIAALLLIDVLWLANYSIASSPGNITMPALTRYTDGKGVQIGCAVNTALSSVTPTVTVTYNPASSDQGTGHSVNTGAFASALAAPKMMPLATPNLPLAAGDTGVTSITNVNISATGTGSIDLFLYKPLAMIPTVNANSIIEWDGFTPLSVDSGSNCGCLGFLALSGGTSACATQMAMLRTVMG